MQYLQLNNNLLINKMDFHKYEFNRTIIVFDVQNSRVHDIDSVMNDILEIEGTLSTTIIERKLRKKCSTQEIANSVKVLLSKNLLSCSNETSHNHTYENEPLFLKGLELNLTDECNFNCKYCTTWHGISNIKRVRMSADTAIAAIDLLFRESGDIINLFIRFNGGEPLLNSCTFRAAVLYAKKLGLEYNKKVGFQLLTNGSVMNRKIVDFIAENNIQLQISIDGPRGVHDSCRVTKSGIGTHDKVINNISKVISHYSNRMIGRATLTSSSLSYLETIEYLRSLGFLHVVVEPVYFEEGDAFGLNEEAISLIKQDYDNTAKKVYYGGKNRIYTHMSLFIRYILNLCRQKIRYYHCGAGKNFLGISGSGDIYPCSELARQKDLCFGNVYNGLEKERLLQFLSSINVINKYQCNDCWARFLCGGGCFAMAKKIKGEIQNTLPYYCGLERKRIELSIWLYHKFLLEKPEVFFDIIDINSRDFWLNFLNAKEFL